MNQELENKLYKDFPDLFQEHKLDMYQTCMCWGLECGDGWEPIIRHACVMLSGNSRRPIRKKELFPHQDKFQVWLHNKCRRIEKVFKLSYGTLYQVPSDRYVSCKGFGVKFTQIKQKFGTLRIYYDIYPKFTEEEIVDACLEDLNKQRLRYEGFVDGVIEFAIHLSSHTCERDGNPGKLESKGRFSTLCEKCRSMLKQNEKANNS
jgi:hypothetical protein